MKRRTLSIAIGFAALGLATALCDVAWAQGGGRRGGFGGRGFGFGRFGATHQIDLVGLPEVETELKLTDEQKTTIAALTDEFREERRAQFGGGGGGGGGGGFGPEAQAERAKLNADFAAKLNEALDETQRSRLLGIYLQVNGPTVLNEEAIAKVFELTDEQKTELTEVANEQRQEMFSAFQDMQDMEQEERLAKIEELNKARDEALLAVLTDDQKKEFEELKGEKLEIDLTQLRGRGRGGFGGGGRRGGDGGNQ
jgi:hypothetical protein